MSLSCLGSIQSFINNNIRLEFGYNYTGQYTSITSGLYTILELKSSGTFTIDAPTSITLNYAVIGRGGDGGAGAKILNSNNAFGGNGGNAGYIATGSTGITGANSFGVIVGTTGTTSGSRSFFNGVTGAGGEEGAINGNTNVSRSEYGLGGKGSSNTTLNGTTVGSAAWGMNGVTLTVGDTTYFVCAAGGGGYQRNVASYINNCYTGGGSGGYARASASPQPGLPGTYYGGGGGGGGSTGGNYQAGSGGTGYQGVVIVWFLTPT